MNNLNSEIDSNLSLSGKLSEEEIAKLLNEDVSLNNNKVIEEEEEKTVTREELKTMIQIKDKKIKINKRVVKNLINNKKILFFVLFNILSFVLFIVYVNTTFYLFDEKKDLITEKNKIEKSISQIRNLSNAKTQELIEKSSYYISEEDIKEYINKIKYLNQGKVTKVEVKEIKYSKKYSNVIDLEVEVGQKEKFIFDEEILVNIIYKKMKSGYLDLPNKKTFITKSGNKINIKIVSIKKAPEEKTRSFILSKLNKIK